VHGDLLVTTLHTLSEILGFRMASIGPDGPAGGYFPAAGPVPW